MFDITSTKLLILAIVALIVVGPKDLPVLLRTVGKYLGVVRRHAAEFRAQFDEAMREAELAELRKEFESVGREMKDTLEDGAGTLTREVDGARREVSGALAEEAPESGAEDAPQERLPVANVPSKGAAAPVAKPLAASETAEKEQQEEKTGA
jgi:sec-independent protein translocase protein TatB